MATIKVKAIIPRNAGFDMAKFEANAAQSLNKIRGRAQSEFEKTVATWREKPVFRGARATPKSLTARMWGNTQKWIWVVRGTRPHVITPRRAPSLRFQAGFTSKTIPRKITSRRGGRSGPMVSTRLVNHPGTQARDFDIVIAEMLQPELAKEVRNDIKKATP